MHSLLLKHIPDRYAVVLDGPNLSSALRTDKRRPLLLRRQVVPSIFNVILIAIAVTMISSEWLVNVLLVMNCVAVAVVAIWKETRLSTRCRVSTCQQRGFCSSSSSSCIHLIEGVTSYHAAVLSGEGMTRT